MTLRGWGVGGAGCLSLVLVTKPENLFPASAYKLTLGIGSRAKRWNMSDPGFTVVHRNFLTHILTSHTYIVTYWIVARVQGCPTQYGCPTQCINTNTSWKSSVFFWQYHTIIIITNSKLNSSLYLSTTFIGNQASMGSLIKHLLTHHFHGTISR